MKKALNPAGILALALSVLIGSPVMAAESSPDIVTGRVGMAQNHQPISVSRMPNASVSLGGAIVQSVVSDSDAAPAAGTTKSGATQTTPASTANGAACRDAYRQCMDDFCLLDESEGNRCACSNRINSSKSIIKDINAVQSDAEKLYTTGVEYEKLGAQALLVFGSGQTSKRKGIDWNAWMNTGTDGALDSDEDVGDNLYAMASDGCAAKLAECGTDANMEENLYMRSITSDCRNFGAFLEDQKKIADGNKAAAEKAVRAARTSMLGETNKYTSPGACLLPFKACISDKGGCGENFENCLDASLLARRANACENVLDQCMAVKKETLALWDDESKMVLKEAAKYADTNKRATCRARTWACLEDSCGTGYSTGTATSSQCLNNVSVAAGICPVIDECNTLVSGFKSGINSELGELRAMFCQNDLDKCLQDKCGSNYSAPACLGKTAREIATLCPQEMFPACKGQEHFEVILTAILWEIDSVSMTNCINHFAESLGAVCGLDMTCIPNDPRIQMAKTLSEAEGLMVRSPDGGKSVYALNADAQVDEFFKQFEKDITIKACAKIGRNVFNQTKLLAYIGAENRAYRAVTVKIAELARAADVETARGACNAMKSNDDSVVSVNFEPSLRNCHICRTEKVCQEGGENEWTSALKGFAGGAVGGAGIGTMASAGAGTWIGAGVGALAGGALGYASGGERTFCQDLTACEDLNMDGQSADIASGVTTTVVK
jgi:hypothetical protein